MRQLIGAYLVGTIAVVFMIGGLAYAKAPPSGGVLYIDESKCAQDVMSIHTEEMDTQLQLKGSGLHFYPGVPGGARPTQKPDQSHYGVDPTAIITGIDDDSKDSLKSTEADNCVPNVTKERSK